MTQQKHNATMRVLELVRKARTAGIGTSYLNEVLTDELTPTQVRKILGNLRDTRHIHNIGGKNVAVWVAAEYANRPGVTAHTKAKPSGVTVTGAREFYDGAELRRNPGITEDRMLAFTLPSLSGKWRVWPDGRRELA